MARKPRQAIYNSDSLPGFIGNFSVKITNGYRTLVPSEFRGLLLDVAIITKGFDSAFIIIPRQNWQKLIDPISNTSFLQRSVRDTTRYLIANSYVLDLDEQGRFVVPLPLRSQFSSLHITVPGKLVFAGMLNYIEVWAPEAWSRNQDSLSTSIDKIAESLNNGQE